MADKKELAPANAMLAIIAAIVTAGAIFNAFSALHTDTVWTPSARGFSLHQTERSADPFSFCVILGLNAGFAGYLCWDLWRKHRRWRHKR